jgi:hypothetical protein
MKRGMKAGSICYGPGEKKVLQQFDREIAKANQEWKSIHRKLSRSKASGGSAPKTSRKKSKLVTVTAKDLGLTKSGGIKVSGLAAIPGSKSAKKAFAMKGIKGLHNLPGSLSAKKAYARKRVGIPRDATDAFLEANLKALGIKP